MQQEYEAGDRLRVYILSRRIEKGARALRVLCEHEKSQNRAVCCVLGIVCGVCDEMRVGDAGALWMHGHGCSSLPVRAPPWSRGGGGNRKPPPHPPTQKTSRLCALAALDPDSPSPVATPNHLITWQPFGLPKYEIWLFEERGLRAQAQD